MRYFELAEDLAADPPTAEGRALARTLFVLAYELDRILPTPIGLGPSACLALAEIADTDDEARWLLEVGRAFDQRPAATVARWYQAPRGASDPASSLLLAEALSSARADAGKFTRAILRRPEIVPLVPRLRGALGPAERILDVGETRPHCPGCALRRYNNASGQGIDSLDPCPVCSGNHGLRLSAENLLLTLRVEATLTGVHNPLWSAQILTDSGAPLREPDPSELARAYHADPGAPYWSPGGSGGNLGQWIAAPIPAPTPPPPSER